MGVYFVLFAEGEVTQGGVFSVWDLFWLPEGSVVECLIVFGLWNGLDLDL
jgi:hypothetical protein